MRDFHLSSLRAFAVLLAIGMTMGLATEAQSKPLVLAKSSLVEELFQAYIVSSAMESAGFPVFDEIKSIEYATAHVALGNGDIDVFAAHWFPMHADFYLKAGADKKLFRKGFMTENCLQGYLIDKKTADRLGITHIGQLTDPKIARLFDSDGDGKANLAGCNPGWGCEKVIEHQLTAFKLRDTVEHDNGSYSAIIADTITRFRAGKPVLYYSWTPYWVSGQLVPGKDVVWLEVPFSALPGVRKGTDTTLANGKNYGFEVNSMRLVANKETIKANPGLGTLLASIKISPNDISAQNGLINAGQKSEADIRRHADAWIRAHQSEFDGWVSKTKESMMMKK